VDGILRFAIGVQNKAPLDKIVNNVRFAEKQGFESAWVAENLYYRDALATLASLSNATSRIALAAGAINCFSRHPAQVALTVASIVNFANRPFCLGVSAGTETRIRLQLGMNFDRPYTTLSEFVMIVNKLLKGEEVDFHGSKFQITNVRLDDPPKRKVSVYIAAVARKALSVACSVGTAVLLDYGGSVKYAKQCVDDIRDLSAQNHQDPENIDIAALLLCSISEDRQEALKVAKEQLLPLLSAPKLGESLLERSDEDPSICAKLRRYYSPYEGKYGTAEAMTLLDDELTSRLAIIGNKNEMVARLNDYLSTGIKLPVLFPVPEERSYDFVKTFSTIRQEFE
jgi:5,10-methylenetetrahydromethanopterin reductase